MTSWDEMEPLVLLAIGLLAFLGFAFLVFSAVTRFTFIRNYRRQQRKGLSNDRSREK